MASREVKVQVDVIGLPEVKAMFERAKAEVERLRAALNEEGDERIDYLLRDSNRLRAAVDAARQIAFDPETISALEHGVIGTSPETYSGISKDEALGYAVDALRDIRAALTPVADPAPHTTSDEETT